MMKLLTQIEIANYQKIRDLLTLPYTETTLVDQPFASKTLNVNPFNVFTQITRLS